MNCCLLGLFSALEMHPSLTIVVHVDVQRVAEDGQTGRAGNFVNVAHDMGPPPVVHVDRAGHGGQQQQRDGREQCEHLGQLAQ